jgi:DNA gyrase subunit A
MARRTSSTPPPEADFTERIVDIDVEEEMQGAFLEYAYSVIYSRALPDARDGLKPVQRRILFGMSELGLRPERGHVKSSRVVGEVMGKYHPHGDGSIYDALVRLSQPFTMRLPLVDGHGNFGSLDDGPAAARYTEARLAPAAMLMTASLDEETVDFVPNYDDQLTQPGVMPAAFPSLLVNGASGIAVGMATNMAPHNLVEVIGAARHLMANPQCSLDDLMKFVPGPDLPCGGKIVGLEGIRDAYLTGRGSFRTRATTRIEHVTPRKLGIIVTELPYLVGPEKVIEKIKDLVQSKKLQGISDVKDLTDRKHGLHLVIEIKGGFHPQAVLEQLFKMTPMEDNFGINNVALVEGQPRTLGLKNLLQVYVDFRLDVVRRRSAFRLRKREERLHLVEGLLIAILDIDEVIQVIRASDDAAIAKARLMDVFDLSDPQATYILDLQLRRLTKFSRVELETEKAELERQIEALRAILGDEKLLRKTVSNELAEVAKAHGTPRRTVLLESAGKPLTTATPLELTDDPCWVLLSSTGLMARTTNLEALPSAGSRHKHDAVVAAVSTTVRGHVALITSRGRMIRLAALDLPILPPTNGTPSLSGGAPLGAFVDLPKDEQPLTLTSLSPDSPGLALGTARGVVKRVTTDYPGNKDDWEIISLKQGDQVVGAVELRTGDEDLVFITSDAQLLHFPAAGVRPQGRTAAGMAGIKLAGGAHSVFFTAVDPAADNLVVTSSGSSGALPGTEPGSLKVTPYSEYPAKGRATGGVRCHRFLRGEDILVLGWVGGSPAKAAAANGVALELPEATGKRDGSGLPAATSISAIVGPLPEPNGVSPSAGSSPSAGFGGAASASGPEATPEFPAGRG